MKKTTVNMSLEMNDKILKDSDGLEIRFGCLECTVVNGTVTEGSKSCGFVALSFGELLRK